MRKRLLRKRRTTTGARVLIDALGAPAHSGGMRLHATEVVQAWLSDWGDVDDVVLVGPPWVRGVQAAGAPVRIVVWPNDNPIIRSIGQQLVTPLVFLVTRREFLLSTNSLFSRLIPGRLVTVVAHDWRHVHNPDEFSPGQLLYRRLWRRSALRAGSVVCVSDKTQKESVALLGRTDVVTIENGRDHARRWKLRDTAPAAAPPGPYVLTYGHHTNKRPELVVSALAALQDEGLSLVLLGATGELAAGLRLLSERLGVARRVLLPGYVSETDYEWLVAHAAAIVVASSDEGFGLPLAEAAALGVPAVVTEDSGVAGLFSGSARGAEPTADGIAAALHAALHDDARRPRSSGNTWRETVAQLRAVTLRQRSTR